MAIFRWQDIDHRLVLLKLLEMSQALSKRITAEEGRIRFENRLNLNSNTLPSLVLKMKEKYADEQAQKMYEIYCEVWQTQGHEKSAAFVRAVSPHILRMLEVRARSIERDFLRFVRSRNSPGSLTMAHRKSLDFRMQQLRGRWQRRLEIEARECEHVERRAASPQRTIQKRNMESSASRAGETTAAIHQTLPAEDHREGHGSLSEPSTKRPGRRPRLSRAFVEYAGTLWREATLDARGKVSSDRLRQIASALDADSYLPPSKYLEGKYAKELKEFNRRNSNSKIGPVTTWSQLVSLDDKDTLYGMRRLLSRCGQKRAVPLSGN